jgi:hypothetical protein
VPFELTHLAVGMQVSSKPWSASFLAGLIYPDSRYLAGVERQLTHSLEPVAKCPDQEFVAGVKLHIKTDKIWDELIANESIDKPDRSMSDPVFTGVLKLIHDRIAYRFINRPDLVASLLWESKLPAGLPISQPVWKKWVKALGKYLLTGPTIQGWYEMAIKVNFQAPEDLPSRLKAVDRFCPELEPTFEKIHRQLTDLVSR